MILYYLDLFCYMRDRQRLTETEAERDRDTERKKERKKGQNVYLHYFAPLFSVNALCLIRSSKLNYCSNEHDFVL